MASYRFASRPSQGEAIAFEQGALKVPANPVIPFVEGDGTGPDIWRASVRVFDAAVEKAYGGERKVSWMKVFAGEESHAKHGEWLPDETLEAFKEFRVSIKGPLSTPVGGGIRSLNVMLRQVLDLYACIRPVRYFEGVGNPMKEPEKLNVVIFRENTEDVYAGIEWKAGSPEANELIEFIHSKFGKDIRANSAIGIKPMSEFGSRRLVKMAARYALENNRKSLTLVHKGNIMKFTEGAFRDWGYDEAAKAFPGQTCTEAELSKGGGSRARRLSGREGSHRRRDVPAAAASPRRVRRHRDAEPERRLHLGRGRRAGRWSRDCARRQRRRRPRGVRSDARHRAEVREPRQDQPGQRDPLGRDDVRVHGMEGSWQADRDGTRERDQEQAGHVRSRTPDVRLDGGEHLRFRRSDHQGDARLRRASVHRINRAP